jgi:hypothetical protein
MKEARYDVEIISPSEEITQSYVTKDVVMGTLSTQKIGESVTVHRLDDSDSEAFYPYGGDSA